MPHADGAEAVDGRGDFITARAGEAAGVFAVAAEGVEHVQPVSVEERFQRGDDFAMSEFSLSSLYYESDDR